ncbi:MAG: hypothetical protein HY060_22230 [Proteobacteria bacterium]|nr:hypothetical protein [Pseudomonadota bacterium]
MTARGLRGWLIALAALLALATGALTFRPAAMVFATPLTEDGFYSLAVARNVAAGAGVTADGRQPTNGFQPLFTFVEAAAYRISAGDEVLALRLVIAVSWLLYVATGWLVGALAADAVEDAGPTRALRRWLATLLYAGGFLTFMHHFNGLETGCVLFLYALAWRLYQRGWFERPGGPVIFGGLLGLLVLARIDSAVFVALFAAWQLITRWRTDPLAALWRAGAPAAIALIVSSPWWAYNFFEFGSLMPTSGTAQQEWGLFERRLRWVLWALGASSLPTLWLGRYDELFHDGILLSGLRALVIAALLVLILRAVRQAGRPPRPGTRHTLGFGLVLATAIGALALYYGLSFIAYWFYYRYLFPVALPACVSIAWWAAPLALRRPVWAGALVAMLCLPTVISAVLAQHGRTLHVETVYWEQLALIAEHVPEADAVAAGQTGTLNYFRPRVVNVDGKVNREAIPYQARMWDYLAARDVRWFADWPFYVEKYLGATPEQHGWRQVGAKGYWQLWHRN